MIPATTSTASDWKEILPFSRILVEGAQELFDVECLQDIFYELPASAKTKYQEYACASEKAPGSILMFSDEAVRFLPVILEKRFGVRGGRGLSVRIGRSAFKYVLKHYGQSSGLLDQSFRLMPAPRRMEVGLNRLSQIFNQHFNEQVEVLQEGSYWLWRMQNCGNCCEGRNTDDAGCYLIVGLLQEFLSWAGGGRYHRVIEQECVLAGGDACVFCLEKKPLD
jgi:hypothetical protein